MKLVGRTVRSRWLIWDVLRLRFDIGLRQQVRKQTEEQIGDPFRWTIRGYLDDQR